MGFYYEESNSSNFVTKPIEGFYYDREDDLFKDENGFYYDRSDAVQAKNQTFWNLGEGSKLILLAIPQVQTEIEAWDLNRKHHATKRNLQVSEIDVEKTIQLCLDTFKANCNPGSFLKNGGDLVGRIKILLENNIKEQLGQGKYQKWWDSNPRGINLLQNSIHSIQPSLQKWINKNLKTPENNQDRVIRNVAVERLLQESVDEMKAKTSPAALAKDDEKAKIFLGSNILSLLTKKLSS